MKAKRKKKIQQKLGQSGVCTLNINGEEWTKTTSTPYSDMSCTEVAPLVAL